MMEDREKTEQRVSEQRCDFSEIEKTEISEKYRITGKQGLGGCSVVYDARRLSDNLHVAIKVLSLPEGLEEDEAVLARKRFFCEARILMSLQNEHSVKCFEYGLLKGAPCVVLEFVEGQQLDVFLREFGALPFEYGVGVICQVLEALGEAHSKGVIHRDIKPANILIIPNSMPPEVRLIDFGIATLQNSALGEGMKTRLGSVRGTPSYMAPELFSGMKSATPESDLYAVGLVLCEALTGSVCVSGASLMQIAFKQKHEELKIPSLIPECLAGVIRKCCAKSVAERYHSADEVIGALKANLAEACDKREACEAAYLKSIEKGGGEEKTRKSVAAGLLIGGIAAIALLVGIIAYSLMMRADAEAAAAAAVKAQADAAARAEEARLAHEADKAEAVKAAEDKARLEAEAKAEAEAKSRAESERIAQAQALADAEKAEAEKNEAAPKVQVRKPEKTVAQADKNRHVAPKAQTVTKKDPYKGGNSSSNGKKSTGNTIPMGLF